MNIDTNTIVSMTEANQNFSMVTRIVDQYGTAVIFKNNKPNNTNDNTQYNYKYISIIPSKFRHL